MEFFKQFMDFCQAEPYWALTFFVCGYILGIIYF